MVYQIPRERFSHSWRSFDNLLLKNSSPSTSLLTMNKTKNKKGKKTKLKTEGKLFTVREELPKN